MKIFLTILSVIIIAITPLKAIPPKFKFYASTYTLKQGDTIRIDTHSNNELKSCSIKFNNHEYRIFHKETTNDTFKYTTFIGIPHQIEPGQHKIKYSLILKNGSKFIKTIPITVNSANFKHTKLTFNKTKTKVVNDRKQLSYEASLIGRKFKSITPYPLYSDSFIQPSEGRYTSMFGEYRSYNNILSRGHVGVDIANVSDTPIIAANSGEIILSETLNSHGNTIMIDHGLGIITIYNHLNSLLVDEGTFVEKGQAIGTMGQTGIATGVHLHWGMSVQNIRVNPLYWLDQKNLY